MRRPSKFDPWKLVALVGLTFCSIRNAVGMAIQIILVPDLSQNWVQHVEASHNSAQNRYLYALLRICVAHYSGQGNQTMYCQVRLNVVQKAIEASENSSAQSLMKSRSFEQWICSKQMSKSQHFEARSIASDRCKLHGARALNRRKVDEIRGRTHADVTRRIQRR